MSTPMSESVSSSGTEFTLRKLNLKKDMAAMIDIAAAGFQDDRTLQAMGELTTDDGRPLLPAFVENNLLMMDALRNSRSWGFKDASGRLASLLVVTDPYQSTVEVATDAEYSTARDLNTSWESLVSNAIKSRGSRLPNAAFAQRSDFPSISPSDIPEADQEQVKEALLYHAYELFLLATHPDMRGRRYARLLGKEAETAVYRSGGSAWLTVEDPRLAAEYAKSGYEVKAFDEFTDEFGDQHLQADMFKPLAMTFEEIMSMSKASSGRKRKSEGGGSWGSAISTLMGWVRGSLEVR